MSGCAGNHYYVDNDDTAQAEWRFTVASGSSYLVMITWDVWDENVSDALFAVYDGVALEDESPVNLKASPGDVVEAGREWRQLGAFTVTSSGVDNLRVTLAGNSAGRVVTDAVRIVEVGPTVRYEYGQMTSLTDPSGNVMAFVYDDLGRLVSEEVLLDGIPYAQAYEYDLAGNLVREVDRNGRIRDYGYDALNREIAEPWYADLADASLGVNAQNAVARHYDVLGRVGVGPAFQLRLCVRFAGPRRRRDRVALCGHRADHAGQRLQPAQRPPHLAAGDDQRRGRLRQSLPVRRLGPPDLGHADRRRGSRQAN